MSIVTPRFRVPRVECTQRPFAAIEPPSFLLPRGMAKGQGRSPVFLYMTRG